MWLSGSADNINLVGPGNCLGMLAAKTGPTAVRGQFYGIAAAIGKVGAFAGTWGQFALLFVVESALTCLVSPAWQAIVDGGSTRLSMKGCC